MEEGDWKSHGKNKSKKLNKETKFNEAARCLRLTRLLGAHGGEKSLALFMREEGELKHLVERASDAHVVRIRQRDRHKGKDSEESREKKRK